jgi:prevent-host-death family protein
MTSVGTYEAKTRLSELIAKVNRTGEQIAITNHGVTVAMLTPPPDNPKSQNETFAEAVTKWREVRKGTSLKGLRVRDLINEGRR